MAEQPLLLRARRSCPPSIEGAMRARYMRIIADLAKSYGVPEVYLRVHGRSMELRGPRGALYATSTAKPAHPMPAIDDPRWYGWCAQAALWAHRSRGCRGCGKQGKSLRLSRQGQCPACRAEDKKNEQRRQLGLGFDDIGAAVEAEGVDFDVEPGTGRATA